MLLGVMPMPTNPVELIDVLPGNKLLPVTARALLPIVAPPIAKDVALAEPSDGLKLEEMVHAIVSTISLSAQAVPRTTVDPVVAVYSEEESLEPL
jgi:hypothetical protein